MKKYKVFLFTIFFSILCLSLSSCGEKPQSGNDPDSSDASSYVDGTKIEEVSVSNEGILSWSKLKIASKYMINITYPTGVESFEIPRTENTLNLTKLPNDLELLYGKNQIQIDVYTKDTNHVEGTETIESIESSKLVTVKNLNSGYSILSDGYSDDTIKLSGFYQSESNSKEFNKEIAILDDKKIQLNLLEYISLNSSGKELRIYSSESDREFDRNPLTNFYFQYSSYISGGDSKSFYVRAVNESSYSDYNLNVLGTTYVHIKLNKINLSSEGLVEYTDLSSGLLNDTFLELDYIDINQLYEAVDDNMVIRDEEFNIYERNKDYILPLQGGDTYNLYCEDKTTVENVIKAKKSYADKFNFIIKYSVGEKPSAILLCLSTNKDTKITVPGSLASIPVCLQSHSFNSSNAQEIYLENGIEELPSGLFYRLEDLRILYIPESVTTATNIFSAAGSYTTSENVLIYVEASASPSGFNSTWNEIGYRKKANTVYSCRDYEIMIGDTKYILPDSTIDGETWSRLGIDIHSIEELTIPQAVKVIGASAFKDFSNLKNIILPDSLTSIGESAFYNCTSLSNITIPESVTSIGENAFYMCYGLQTVIILGSVTGISINAFDYYYDYKLTILCKETSNPTGWTPEGGKIKVLWGYIDQVEVESVVYGLFENGFSVIGCNENSSQINLKAEIEYCGKMYPVYSIENLILSNFEELIIPQSVICIGKSAFSWCFRLTNITIPSSVTSIGESAFYGCDSLTSVTIPSSVTSIGFRTFYRCMRLTSVTIPSSVTSIGSYAFYDCSSLTNITIPTSVTSIGESVFYNCDRLTSVTIPTSVTSIGSYAFDNCYRLTSVTIPSSVTSIGSYAFSYCSNLTNVIIPSSITSIEDGVFKDCSSLTNITIPSSVTSIGGYAFSDCVSLENMIIPSSVTSIGDGVFKGCSSLTNIAIPSSVTSIGGYAFYNCSSLTKIIIPTSVTVMGEGVFYYCDNLTIYCEESSKPSDWDEYWNYSNRPVVWSYVKP